MNYSFVLLIVALLHQSYASFNSQPTYVSIGEQNATGTRVLISPDQLIIAVGFADGTFKIFDNTLAQVCTSTSALNSSVIDIVWLESFGPVTLDQTNTITLWTSQCNISSQFTLNETVKDLAENEMLTGDQNGTKWGIIAANFQNRIEEFDIQTGISLMIYSFPPDESSIEMIYNLDGESTVLLVSTNGSILRKFEIENGTELGNFSLSSPVWQMEKLQVSSGNVVIGITENNNILRFDSSGQVLDRGKYPKAVSMTACPTTKEFALAYESSASMGVYLYGGHIQQILGLSGFPKSIDCSASYLISIDEFATIHLYTYEEFKSYIIAIIGGVLGGIVFLVIAVFVIMKYRSKLIKDQQNQQYKSTKRNKYPRQMVKQAGKKQSSIQMFKVSTFDTTMAE